MKAKLLSLVTLACFLCSCFKDDGMDSNCSPYHWYSNVNHNFYFGGTDSSGVTGLTYMDINTPSDICTSHPVKVEYKVKSKNGVVPNVEIFGYADWSGLGNELKVQLTYNADSSRYEAKLDNNSGLDMASAFNDSVGKINLRLAFRLTSSFSTVDDAKTFVESTFTEMFLHCYYTECTKCTSGLQPPGPVQYTTIMPANRGTRLNLSHDGKRVAVWDPNNDSILVYNTENGSLVSAVVHAGPSHIPISNAVLIPDGSKVLTVRELYATKLWDAATGSFIQTFPDMAYEWRLIPGRNSLLGFGSFAGGVPLNTKENVIEVALGSGTEAAWDTFHEILYPFIAGARANGEYLMVNYPVDLSDPFSPTGNPILRTRSLTSHSLVRTDTMYIQAYRGQQLLSDDGNTLCFIQGVNSEHFMMFYSATTGIFITSHQLLGYLSVAMGPGSDRACYANDRKIGEFNFRTSTANSGKYSIGSQMSGDFFNLDVSGDGSRLAAAFYDLSNMPHIVIWKTN